MTKLFKISYTVYKIVAFSLGTFVIFLYVISHYTDHNDINNEKTYLMGNIQQIDKTTGLLRIVDNQGNLIATHQLATVHWIDHTQDRCAHDIHRLLTYAQQHPITFDGTYTEGLQINIKPDPIEPYTNTGNLNTGIQTIIEQHHPLNTSWW